MTLPETKILIIPGLSNSGAGHWQTLWESKNPAFQRVEQRDWEQPERQEWIAKIDAAVVIQASSGQPVMLVAHSLGCSAVAHWVAAYPQHANLIRGALLVAPADVDAPNMPAVIKNFSPMPLQLLPFPTIVVASQNDEYVSLSRAEFFAKNWGSRFVDIGQAGHINTAAGFGEWSVGEQLLGELLQKQDN